VSVSLKREGDTIRCAVSDNGPGIPAKHLPYLARRFYRAAPQEMAGSGLGLALAEEILRRHESHLEMESRAEGAQTGTCVRFALAILATGEVEP
jgi:signal transduction histidine kinase